MNCVSDPVIIPKNIPKYSLVTLTLLSINTYDKITLINSNNINTKLLITNCLLLILSLLFDTL